MKNSAILVVVGYEPMKTYHDSQNLFILGVGIKYGLLWLEFEPFWLMMSVIVIFLRILVNCRFPNV